MPVFCSSSPTTFTIATTGLIVWQSTEAFLRAVLPQSKRGAYSSDALIQIIDQRRSGRSR